MITESFVITFLAYLVTGTLPPVVAHYILRVRFLGGTVAALLVGIIAAVAGGLVQTILGVPDLLVIGGIVEVFWPLLASIGLTALYAVVSGR